MRIFRYLTALIMAISLAGCEQAPEKEPAGTLMGATGGAIVEPEVGSGGHLLPIVGGTLAGSWLGREIGKSLDSKDRAIMQQTTQKALSSSPAGRKSAWKNPDSGYSGTVTPQLIFINKEGLKCREYQQTLSAKAKIRSSYATACQQKDGLWRVVGKH